MKRKLITGASLGCALLLSASSFGQLSVSTAESLVNTTTTSAQQNPAVSQDTAGRYVVVWESEGQDGDGFGIYAEIYNADHTVRVSEFLVNTSDQTADQRYPAVAMDVNGNFIVAWQSNEDDATSDREWDVYRKLYDIDGNVVSARLRANSTTTRNQMRPAVAINENYILVGWMSQFGVDDYTIRMRTYNASGAALMSPITIDDETADHVAHLDIDMDDQDDAIFVWQADNLDGDRKGIFAAGYNFSGGTTFSQVQVNTTTTGNQQEPSVAVDSAGNAMVVWSSFAQDGDHYGVYSRLMNTSGSFSGGEVIVNSTTADSQDHAKVAASREGNKFVVTWTDETASGDGNQGVMAILYEAGSFQGSDELINSTTNGKQMLSDVVYGSENYEPIIAWQGGNRKGVSSGGDSDGYGVFVAAVATSDTTPPNPICQNVTVYLDGTGNVSIVPSDIDGGSTDNVGVTSLSVSTDSWTCANIGANGVILTVFDAAGNSAACGATVTVLDTVSPTAVCQNLNVYLDGAGNASITAGDVDAGSSDNCSVATYGISQSSFTCTDVGVNNVTLTVTDPSGNIGTCTSNVTVLDTVSPSAVCQNVTVYLDGSGNATITGADLDAGSTDNCGGSLVYGASPSAFTCTDIGANNVTLTVTDPGGNISSCTSTVTVVDSVSPTAVCQDITVYLDGTGNASITSADVDGGSTDNCGTPTLGINVSSFTCANVGPNTVTLTATDGSGNVGSCTAIVTVVDSISPTAVCQDITVYLDGAGNATITTGDIDNGSSDNCAVAGLSLSQSAFTCANVGANAVTLTVTDASGNTSACASTVTIIDSISPTAVCQDITVYLDGTGNTTITTGDIDNGSSDNCSIASYALSQSAFTCADAGANSVTLTVTDASGNSSTCTTTVTIIDSVTPTAVCQDLTVYLDGTGNATITSADVDGGSTDNCGTPTLGINVSSFTCANVGPNTVTLTATDGSGNVGSCTATVTVVDSISPTAVCQDITVYLDGTGNTTITTGDIDNGSSDNCAVAGLSLSQSAFTCANVGANAVTLTVTDASGNNSACASTVTIIDSITPTAVCQDITVYLNGAGNATITSADLDGGSTDNCGTPTLGIDVSSFTCANIGANTVTLSATDASGNVGSCTATVTVSDTISPATPTLADLSDECTITATAPTTSDNCAGIITGTTTDPVTYTGDGTYVITWTFDDGNGNIVTATQNVIIDDITAPVTPILADITAECTATVTAPTTTDNCVGTVTGTTTDPLTYTGEGTNVITWTFDDGNGNTTTATQNVIIDDVTAPVAPTLAGVTGECSATATAPTTTDNCVGFVTGTTTDPLTYSAEGTYVITWTFDDGNGNTTTATQNVIVDDVTAPVSPALADLTDECTVTAVAPTATDNCAGTVTGTTTDPLTYNTQGAFTITWTFDDGNGNTSTATQNVIINDVTFPTASNIDTAFAECIGDVAIDVTLVDDEADNCGNPTVSYVGDVASNGTGCGDTITRTYNVSDEAGNNIDVTQVIILNDVTAPTASNPLTLNVVCLADVPSTTGASVWVTDEADNCGTPTVAWLSDVSSNGTGCSDTITRTFSVTDGCGNAITVEQLIIINDDIAPAADVPALTDITETCEFTPATPTATDNCVGVLNGVPDVSFPITSVGTTVVTWTYTDNCGNTVTQTQNVTITGVDVGTTMASDGITMIATNTNAGVTYQWIDCETNAAVPGATNVNFTPTYGSDFAVIVTENGCADTSACVNSTVGLTNISIDEFNLFPNPTTGQFTVSFDGVIKSIEMIDVTGRIVMTETKLNEGMVDASILAPGKYMVRLTADNGNILTKPIVIGQQ
ncbi:T9SS type A sorting domain-containing protein [Crocinitomicaceae bacterium]|nr:T9SS type A sorting domain-containing protein [Crocinitomicaceae bacterium]